MPDNKKPRVGDTPTYWANMGPQKITHVGEILPNGRIKVTLEHEAEFDPEDGNAYGTPPGPPSGP